MKKRQIRVARTRNNETMTESMFWSMIRSVLRNKSMHWKPVAECKKRAKKTYRGPNKRQRYEYQCAICEKWFPEKETIVDHIIPAGSLRSSSDLPGFVERLFVEVESLQCLCKKCHAEKILKENQERKNDKRTK